MYRLIICKDGSIESEVKFDNYSSAVTLCEHLRQQAWKHEEVDSEYYVTRTEVVY